MRICCGYRRALCANDVIGEELTVTSGRSLFTSCASYFEIFSVSRPRKDDRHIWTYLDSGRRNQKCGVLSCREPASPRECETLLQRGYCKTMVDQGFCCHERYGRLSPFAMQWEVASNILRVVPVIADILATHKFNGQQDKVGARYTWTVDRISFTRSLRYALNIIA